ncbi:MAG: acyltransferase family protein [Succinivibrionaceae bacterium]
MNFFSLLNVKDNIVLSESDFHQSSVQSKNHRTLWIDIAKGLLILLMVIGHSTGMFNQVIYQFHMGAFFILSGYVTNFDKRNVLQTIANKFLTLILPLLTMILCFSLLNNYFVKIGIYEKLYAPGTPLLTLGETLKNFFTRGQIWVWWLGACWFLVELFLVSIFSKVLYEICCKSKDLLIFISFSFLYVSYQFDEFASSIYLTKMFSLAFFLYILGYYLKQSDFIGILHNKLKYFSIIYIVIGCLCFIYFANKHYSIDMANSRFNSWYVDALIVTNGFLFSVCLSFLLSKIKYISTIFSYLGANTIPIIFFHFGFFKIAYMILYLFGIVDISYLTNFVPTDEIGREYWWLIAFVAIVCSLVVWKLFVFSRYISCLVGKNSEFLSYIETKIYITSYSFSSYAQKYSNKISKIRLFFLGLFEHRLFIILCLLLLSLLVIVPIHAKGIILNDELQLFQYRLNHGLFNFSGEIAQGRILLRPLAPINIGLSFIFYKLSMNLVLQLLLIFVLFVLSSYFIQKMIHNKYISYILYVLLICCLPVTFEHAVPNAFIGLVCIPLIELFLSLILFDKYLRNRSTLMMVCSFMLLFLAVFGYEYMILTIPIYFYVYLIKNGYVKGLRKIFNEKYFVCILFLVLFWSVLYMVQPYLLKQGYSGSVVGFVSLESTLNIVKTLYLSSMPGYYWFNHKYEYLRDIYDVGVDHSIFIVLGLFFLPLAFITVCKKTFSLKFIECKMWFTILFFILLPILLSIPNAISKMYQGNVSSSFFTSLPVSTIMYICHCIWIVLLLSYLFVKFNNLVVRILLVSLFSFLVLSTQYSNGIILSKHHSNYTRLQLIENLYQTDFIKNLNSVEIYAPDVFKTYDLLAIHNNYFDLLASIKGVNIKTINENRKSTKDFWLYQINNENVWCLSKRKELVLFSDKIINFPYSFVFENDGKSTPVIINSSKVIKDNNLYIYGFSLVDGKVIEKDISDIFPKAIDMNDLPLKIDMKNNDDARFIHGFYDPEFFGRWASDEIEIPFTYNYLPEKSKGDNNYIELSIEYVNHNLREHERTYKIRVFINGTEFDSLIFNSSLNNGDIKIRVPIKKLSDFNVLNIKFDGVKSPAELGNNGDQRKLSLAVSSIIISIK